MAANYGHVEIMSYLLSQGAEKNVKDKWGTTPLHEATSNNHGQVALMLVDAGADLNVKDAQGRTPLDLASGELRTKLIERSLKHVTWELFHASRAGNLDTLKHLVDGGRVSIDVLDWDSRHPLHLAAEYNHAHVVKWMLETGCNKNVQDKWGITPFHEACKNGHSSIAVLLFEAAADMSIVDVHARTPLDYASPELRAMLEEKLDLWNSALRGDFDTVKHIIETKSTTVNATDQNGNTALFSAASAGHQDIIQYLLDNGASINFQNKTGETPLIVACAKPMEGAAFLLMDSGADVTLCTNDGENALNFALRTRRAKIVRALFARGCRFNLQDSKSKILMRDAVCEDDIDLFEMLQENGVNLYAHLLVELLILASRFAAQKIIAMCVKRAVRINSADERSRTGLHEAAENGHDSVVKDLIEQYGADPNAVDMDGNTPLLLAAQRGHMACAVVLLKNNASADFSHPVFKTLLTAAVEKEQLVCAGLLVRSGVDTGWEVITLVEKNIEVKGIEYGDEDVDVVEHFYQVLLLKAAELARTKCVELLLVNNVDVSFSTSDGQTAVHRAAANGCDDVIEVMLDCEAYNDLDVTDSNAFTPLMLAARNGHVSTCRLLVDKGGANLEVLDNNQRTALGWAVVHRSVECVRYLSSRGADALHEDADKMTAYEWSLVENVVDDLRSGRNALTVANSTHLPTHHASHGRELVDALIQTSEAVRSLRRKFAVKTVWRQSFLYMAMIIVLTILAFLASTRNSEYPFYIGAALKQLFTELSFTNSQGVEITFDTMRHLEDLWAYLRDPFLHALFLADPNIDSTHSSAGYVNMHDRLIGLVRMQQFRVRDDSCQVASEFEGRFKRCYAAFSAGSEDRRTFGEGVGFSWLSPDALGLQRLPGVGAQTWHDGSFAVDVPANYTEAAALMESLYNHHWLDWATRAVTIDLNVYNPNVDLALVVRMFIDLPEAGGLKASFHYTPLRLMRTMVPLDIVTIVFLVVFALLLFLYIYHEITIIRQLRLAYFKHASAYFEMLMYALLLTVFSYHLIIAIAIVGTDWTPQDVRHVDLMLAANLYNDVCDMVAILLVLAWLKTLIFVRIFPVSGPIVQAIFNTFLSPPVLTFTGVFAIIVVSFSIAFHIAFGSSLTMFRTFEYSLLTMFRVVFGDFAHDMEALQLANPALGPILFSVYALIGALVLINLFIAIFHWNYRLAQGMRQAHWNNHLTHLMQSHPKLTAKAAQVLEQRQLIERRWHLLLKRNTIKNRTTTKGKANEGGAKAAAENGAAPLNGGIAPAATGPAAATNAPTTGFFARIASFGSTASRRQSTSLDTSRSLQDKFQSLTRNLGGMLGPQRRLSNFGHFTHADTLTAEEHEELRQIPADYFTPSSSEMRHVLLCKNDNDRTKDILTTSTTHDDDHHHHNHDDHHLPETGAVKAATGTTFEREVASMGRRIKEVELNLIALKVGLESSLASVSNDVSRMKGNLESVGQLQNDRIATVADKLTSMHAAQKRQIAGLQVILNDLTSTRNAPNIFASATIKYPKNTLIAS